MRARTRSVRNDSSPVPRGAPKASAGAGGRGNRALVALARRAPGVRGAPAAIVAAAGGRLPAGVIQRAWRVTTTRRADRGADALNRTEREVYDRFCQLVNSGQHPATAAGQAGDTNYRKLRGTTNQYEIRLSGGSRATFLVDTRTETVDVIQVGGHT